MGPPPEHFRAALCQAPADADALSALGQAHLSANKVGEALPVLLRAARIEPGLPGLAWRIGTALAALGQLPEAARMLCGAIAAAPDQANAYSNLAIVLLSGNFPDTDPVLGLLRRAVALDPTAAAVQANIGLLLAERGAPDLAIPFDRHAAELMPSPANWSRILFNLNYCESLSAEACLAEHRRIGALFDGAAAPDRLRPSPHPRSPGRRRLGFASADFRAHSVSYFLAPLLRGLDRERVEVFCYSDVARPDDVTLRLRGLSDHWHDVTGLSDRELAALIRKDGIDTLIDLAGHTPGNRLGAFALRPARLQMSWLGYANSTGLDAMDHRIVDPVTDPPDALAALASESLLRLEGGFLCYEPPAHAPAVMPRPARQRIMFGTFNNPTKITGATITLWSRILQELPEADLLIKSYKLRDQALRRHITARFAERGIAAERLILQEGIADPTAHLAAYEKIDIALDPLLYNGTATTCEALWMGIPVITLRGDRHSGRVGASLLGRIGLEELIAKDAAHYVEIACRLARDSGGLTALRRSLRPRMAASPLCDFQAFARAFEQVIAGCD